MRYDEIRQHVTEHFQEQLARFKEGVTDGGPPSEGRAVMMQNIRGMMASGWQDHAAQVGEDQAAQQVRAFCEHRGINPDSLAPAVREGLNAALLRGVDTFWRDAIGFLEGLGEFDLDPLPAPRPPAALPDQAANVPSFETVVDQYFTEMQRTAQVRDKTADSKREALALLGEITANKAIGAMTKVDAQAVKQILLRLPKNRNKMAATKSKPLSEIVDLPGIAVIAPRTMNAYISALQTFFGWAVSNGHAANNIFEGTRVRLSKHSKEGRRDAFTPDQLNTLFLHLTDNPDKLIRSLDHKWISLIGMFTGMRLNEVAQLDISDIQQDGGVWFINVTDEGGPNKRLKNPASKRRVPVHTRLLTAGFVEFIAERRKAVSPRLFPALSYCSKNGYGRNAGRWFTDRLLPALGMADTSLVFHSLRHSMTTLLAQADVPDTQVKAILGHEQQGVTYNTYFHGFRPVQLKAAIDKFDF